MHSWQHEATVALRWVRRRPGLTATAVASLALGIGANAAVFSLVDALVLRPLPISDAGSLVRLQSQRNGERGDLSAPDYRDLDDMQDVLTALLASAQFTFSVRAGDATQRVDGELVSYGYFEVLGVALAKGRGFLPSENDAPAAVAVISDRLFRSRFNGDPAILGRLIRVNGRDLTLVGVAPPGFHGFALSPESDLWAPLSMLPTLWPSVVEFFERRDQPGPIVLGRLRPGVGLRQTEAALAVYGRALERAHPDADKGMTLVAVPFADTRLSDPGTVVSYLGIVAGVTAMVFLIACVNVAGLRFSDLSAREGEVAIRRALGASRMRMWRQFLMENLVLYLPAFAASLLVAVGGIDLLRRLNLFRIALAEIDLRLDWRVVGAGLVVALAGAILGSLILSVASRHFVLGGRSGPLSNRDRLRGGLVVVQVALSSVLLVGAGLLARTLQRVYAIDPGFRTAKVLFASVDLQSMEFRYDETRARGFYRDVLERVESLPGVRSAAWSADTPFERFTIITLFVPADRVTSAGEPDWIQADADIVTPGFFRTMGIDLLRGRDFTDQDDEDAPGVVIVNETFARTYWPGSDPLGKRLRVWSRRGVHHDVYQVVGVARDVKVRTLWEKPRTYLYFPLAQRFFQRMNLHVATLGSPMSALPAVREAFRAIDDDLPIFDAHPLGEERDFLLVRQRSVGALLGAAALVALIVTAVGTFGVTAQRVQNRSREVGLRMALGARETNIVRWVLRFALVPVAVGVALGTALALPLSKTIQSLLIRVSPRDALTFSLASMLCLIAALLACWVPARRAARIDPAATLRGE